MPAFKAPQKWEEIAMQPQAAGSFAGGYQFLFAGLPENVEYYVTAGAMTSKHFNIHVTDLPSVKQIRVTYHYPAWTGMPSEIEERGGDLRAVVGTEAELDVTTDRPLQGGQIQLDSGQKIQLTGGQNNVYHGTVKMDQDGVYHVAGVEEGQPVRVSEDFFIEARKANPPQIALVASRPRRLSRQSDRRSDRRGQGHRRIRSQRRHAALFGERRPGDHGRSAEATRTRKQADGSTTLSLEDFKLVPGDLVSVYATAKDANAEAHTDMIFIQADPLNASFRNRSRAAVVEAAAVAEAAISPRKSRSARKKSSPRPLNSRAIRTRRRSRPPISPSFSTQSQSTLHDQAITLSGRLQARELTDEVQAISDFQKDMIAASEAMGPAAQQLQQQKWKDAIPQRTESPAIPAARRSHVPADSGRLRSAGRRWRRWWRRGARSGRALRSRTRYREESVRDPADPSTTAEQKAQEIDDALKKLDELAKREEDLAQQQRNGTQTAEQKWQQEMLQREAEQLQRRWSSSRRKTARASRATERAASPGSSSGQSSGNLALGGQSGSGQQSASANGGQQSADQAADSRQQAAQQALDRLRQANDDMQRAASQSASAADSRRAADRLREATDLLGRTQQQDAAGRINSMAQTAEQLAAQQKQQADHVRNLMAQQNAARAAGKQPNILPRRKSTSWSTIANR